MINVNNLYIRIKDLSQKNRAGYFSVDEYNRHLQDALNLLFEYYAEEFEREKEVTDSLRPFIKQVNIPINDTYCEIPSDYRHRVSAAYRYVLNNENCGTNPTVTLVPMGYQEADEWIDSLQSPIRKPNILKGKAAYRFINGKIQVSEKYGTIEFVYLSKPTGAVMGYTVNPTTLEEVYDAGTSVQIPFLEQDETNLTDIILFLLGIQIRENALMQYVGAKRQMFK